MEGTSPMLPMQQVYQLSPILKMQLFKFLVISLFSLAHFILTTPLFIKDAGLVRMKLVIYIFLLNVNQIIPGFYYSESFWGVAY